MRPSQYPFAVATLYPFALVILFLLVQSTPVSAADEAAAKDEAAAPLVDAKIRQAMQNRDYPAAIKAIDQAAKAKDAPKDYLAYLKGRALYFQKKYDEAAKQFDRMQEEFPESRWVRRARFAKAVALARKGDFRAAELIYRAEAEYLLSADRKQELADIYLEFADAYFKPPKEDEKPNYAKAREFYNKALEVGPKPEKRVEIELLVAQCHQNLNDNATAIKLYQKFIEDHPDSPLELEARYRLGECFLKAGNQVEARRSWEDLLAKHEDASSERIAEAMFNLSRTWRIPSPQNDEELNLGVASLKRFLKRFPEHKLAAKAHLDIARSNMHRGHYDDAVAALKQFLGDKRYQKSEEIAEGRNLLGHCYRLQKKYPEALAAWQEFLAKHPADKAWSTVQREIVNTEYMMGKEQFDAEKYAAAREQWSTFLAKYPLDARSASILYLFGQMNRKQEKWDAAIADWRRVVSKYPKTNPASQAQFAIAEVTETKLDKLEEAHDEYKKVTWGNHAGAARQAIARLTAKQLAIVTERIFRSDEAPKIKVTTRNIESLTIRAYKIDMETYFRKMHLARGVEGLDIALIDPDRTFEFKVPKYAKYQQFENEIEVSLPDDATAGVMAVTISSEKLEATTMLIQSDLDIIVKSSRDEVFVLAENMRTGKPWPGVRLLVSNAKNVFAVEEHPRES